MTVNGQTLEGNWNSVKGQVRQQWGQLTDDELEQARGNVEQLIGLIQSKTGEAREVVEDYLSRLAETSCEAATNASEKFEQYAEGAVESLQDASQQVADSARAGYIEAERFVRKRPAESLAVCFGTGLISGVVIGLLLRR